MKYLLVFDIDGTITLSENQHQTSYVEAMKSLGIEKIDANWEQYIHMTDSFILKENFERNFSIPFTQNFIDDFEIEMVSRLLKLPPVMEVNGAKKMIELVKASDKCAICFATGSLLEPALIKLSQAEIPFNEKVVVGSNYFLKREEIVEKAIENAKEYYDCKHFDHIIAFGDGLWDLKTARNLNLHFVGVGVKHHSVFESENIKSYIRDWTMFNLSQIKKELEIDAV